MGYYVEDEGGDRIKLDASNLSEAVFEAEGMSYDCLLYTSPSPRDRQKSRMPSSA